MLGILAGILVGLLVGILVDALVGMLAGVLDGMLVAMLVGTLGCLWRSDDVEVGSEWVELQGEDMLGVRNSGWEEEADPAGESFS